MESRRPDRRWRRSRLERPWPWARISRGSRYTPGRFTPRLSSEVQWQDGNGRWHAVEGWRAPVDTGVITWSVLKHDFGAGPFRWVLYETLAGRPVAASQPFDLPPAGGEAVRVYIQLAYVPTPFGLQPGVKMTAVDYCWWNCQPQ